MHCSDHCIEYSILTHVPAADGLVGWMTFEVHDIHGCARHTETMLASVQFDMEAEGVDWPLWKTWRFWWVLLSTLLAFGWLIAGIVLVVVIPRKVVVVFEAWRWCIFFAGIMPIFWVSRLLIWMLVRIVEATLFRQWMALYFLAGTKVRCRCGCQQLAACCLLLSSAPPHQQSSCMARPPSQWQTSTSSRFLGLSSSSCRRAAHHLDIHFSNGSGMRSVSHASVFKSGKSLLILRSSAFSCMQLSLQESMCF